MQVASSLLVVAAALVFWGWETKQFAFAIPMAATIAAPLVTRRRITFTPREFARLWDMTLVLLAGAAIYNRQVSSISGAVITFLQWLPILLFPFTAAFLFSGAPAVPRSTFVFWWRGRERNHERGFNPTYLYFAVCLLSASAGTTRDVWFYPAATLLIAAALVTRSPVRWQSRSLPWFLAVALAGYFLQSRWQEFQHQLESRTMDWFAGFFPRQFEDQETHTSLGEIGKLKASGRVVMRIRGENGQSPPQLLRQVSFDQYRRGIWLGTRRQYSPIVESQPTIWDLATGPACTNAVAITAPAPDARMLLPLPVGAARARGLAAARLEQNRFGNLRVWDCSDPLTCTIDYNPNTSHEPPPDRKDLQVPVADEAAVTQIVEQLGVSNLPPQIVLEKLEQFFSSEFRYVPFVKVTGLDPTNTASLVATFLLETRQGHCEYFATASVLALRKAGIPARYATGFAAVEPAGRKEFQIRERHAHSWALAWVDGRWQDFDPSPRGWSPIELQQSSITRPWGDKWSDIQFWFTTSQFLPEIDARLLLYLLLPVVALLALVVIKRRRGVRVQTKRLSLAQSYAWPGLDSEFFLVLKRLEKIGLNRESDETAAAWLLRVGDRQSRLQVLAPIIELHYKYRFDPEGLTTGEREKLAVSVRTWLEKDSTPTSTSAGAGSRRAGL